MRTFNTKQATTAVMLLLAAIGMGSCTDRNEYDDNSVSGEGTICFTADETQDWDDSKATTRGVKIPDDLRTPMPFAQKLRGKTLYLTSQSVGGIDVKKPQRQPEELSLTEAETRGVQRTTPHTDIGILAFQYEGGTWQTKAATTTPNFLYNAQATESGTIWYLQGSDAGKKWPDYSKVLKFFAYSPWNQGSNSHGITLSASTKADAPTLTYAVPTNVADQQDLMTAESGETNYNATGTTALEFKHALAAIRFKMGQMPTGITVTKLSLSNIICNGSMTLGGSMTATSGTTTFSINVNFDTDNPTEYITTDQQVLLMVPQTLSSSNVLTMEYYLNSDDTKATQSVYINMTSHTWTAGRTYTYVISTADVYRDYIINIVPAQYQTSSDAKSNISYTVQSYYTYFREGDVNATKVPVPWEFVGYSTDGGLTWTTTKPAILSSDLSVKSNSFGTVQNQTGYFSIAKNVGTKVNMTPAKHTEALQNATPKGTVGDPWDLSTNSLASSGMAPQNTANCYVVSAPGRYRFPLVYGNAITNGTANTQAYNNALFRTSANRQITDPYIYNNTKDGTALLQPAEAFLLWEDEDIIVRDNQRSESDYTKRDVTLNEDKTYVEFTVTKEKIKQGNAVIGVVQYESNSATTLLWSWHIWFTDEDVTDAIKFGSYEFMPFVLGWVTTTSSKSSSLMGDQYTNMPERYLMVKIRQTAKNFEGEYAEATFSFTQSGFQRVFDDGDYMNGVGVFYQFGRKDPFPHDIRNSSYQLQGKGDDNYFTYAGPLGTAYNYVRNIAASTYQNSILHPNYLYRFGAYSYNNTTAVGTYNDWLNKTDEGKYVWWSGSETANQSTLVNPVKTVYDPCPPGFKVPPYEALVSHFNAKCYSRIVRTATNTTYLWDVINSQDESRHIAIPITGQRYNAHNDESSCGKLYNVNAVSYFWTSTTGDQSQSYVTYTDYSGYYPFNWVNTSGHGYRCNANSILPVRE